MSDSRTPLLDRDEDDEDVSKVEGTKPVTCQQILQEATLVCKILIPVMSAQVVQFGVTLIGVAFVGRLGKLALAGISLAVSIANVTGVQIKRMMPCFITEVKLHRRNLYHDWLDFWA